MFPTIQDMPLHKRKVRFAVSRSLPQPKTDIAGMWHLNAGYAGLKALEQLILQTKGVMIKGLLTIECQEYSLRKVYNILSCYLLANRA